MKSLILLFALFANVVITHAQEEYNVDSLKRALAVAKEDTNKIILLFDLANSYTPYNQPDSVLIFSQQALNLATQLHHSEMIAFSKGILGSALWVMGDYLQADKYLSEAINFWEAQHSSFVLGLYASISSNKRDYGAYKEALYYSFKGDSLDNTYDTQKVWTFQNVYRLHLCRNEHA